MKETFYFTHDYNTKTDPKIKRLLQKYGFLGYGIFWSLVEDLYQNANALPTDYDSIAYDLRVDESLVKSIINDFGLFESDEKVFWSNSVGRRLNERTEKSEKAKESARARWNKQKDANAYINDANALQPQYDSNAIKEKKEKEIKREEIIKENNNSSTIECVSENSEICVSHTKIEEITSQDLGEEKKITPPPKVPAAPPPQYGDGELQVLCRAFLKDNPDKYTTEMFKHFLGHWTAIVQKGKDKGKELWRTEKTFQLSSRLTTWYNIGQKNEFKPTIHNPKTTGRHIVEQSTGVSSILREGSDGTLFRVEKNGVQTFAG